MSSKLLLFSLFIHGFQKTLVSKLKPHCFHFDSSLKRSSKNSNWLSWIPTQSSLVNSELLFFIVIQYTINPLVQVFCIQFSSLTMIYLILGVRSGSLTFLVTMSGNCRPPSHHYILSILHFSPFLTKCILLAICLVCFVSLPFLAMHMADLLSKTIKGASFGTMYGSSLNNSWTNILKYAKAIPAVHAALYSLSALDCATGPGTCVPWSIGPPWY